MSATRLAEFQEATETLETMSSREIAKLTGKQHQHVKRDIEKVLSDLKIDASRFGHSYLDSQNRSQHEYRLPKFECEVLVTGYDTERRAAVIRRWYELESGQASPIGERVSLTLEADPYRKLQMDMSATVSAVEFAQKLGFESNQALLSADRMIKKRLGFSPLEDMGQKALPAPVQEMTFTPTQLGQMCIPVCSAVTMNLRLQGGGLQEREGDVWVPTDSGKPFCEILDVGKAHSDGTPVKQVKWYKTVLGTLAPADPLPAPRAEGGKMADPEQEPRKYTEGRTLKPGQVRKQIRKRGRYELGNYFSMFELADMTDTSKGHVIEVLEKQRIVKWKGSGKRRKFVLTDKGWRYGLMYDPSQNEFHDQRSKRLMTTNCQPVFGYDILDLF